MSVRRNPFVAALFACILLLASCTDAVDDSVAEPLVQSVSPSSDAEQLAVADLADLPGLIVMRDGAGQIVVVAPDGEARTVLGEAGSEHSQPTWSTSGDRVAWSSFDPDGATLTTAAADGTGEQSEAVPTPAFYLSWSPGDTWIAGLRSAGNGMETFISPVAPGEEANGRSITNAAPFYFDWATDTDMVAAVGGQLLVDISTEAGTEPVVRDLGTPLGFFQAPAILPTGSILAALNIDGANTLVQVDGTSASPIATATSLMYLAASPDGQQLAVLVAPDGGSTEPEQQVISFQFDEVVELEAGRVTIIDLETGEVEADPDEDVLAMQWSPDSGTLALLRFTESGLRWDFASDAEPVQGTEFVPSQRYLQRYLPFFDQYNLSSTWWSPDSSAIVFSGSVAGESGVFVDLVDDEAGATRISDGDIAFWSPR